MSEIFKDLCFLKLTSEESAEKFRKGTRDFDDLVVFKDKSSGVIFLKDFYTGDKTYIAGKYRKDEIAMDKINTVTAIDNDRIPPPPKPLTYFNYEAKKRYFLIKINTESIMCCLNTSSVGYLSRKNIIQYSYNYLYPITVILVIEY